jgi:hypothetical protein
MVDTEDGTQTRMRLHACSRQKYSAKSRQDLEIAFTRDRSEIEEVAALLGFSTSERPGVVGEQVWIEMAKKLKVID